MKVRIILWLTICLASIGASVPQYSRAESTRKERNHISKGNDYYNQGRYRDAMREYKEALKENPSSLVGKYNLGLSEIRLGSNPADTTQTAKDLLQAGKKAMEQVSGFNRENPNLASRANYNLGNLAFESEDYPSALNFYKQALRLNPDDNAARRNLRITQLKLQNQDNNGGGGQDNQEQQDNPPPRTIVPAAVVPASAVRNGCNIRQ